MQQSKMNSFGSFEIGLKRKRRSEPQDVDDEQENIPPPPKFNSYKLEWTEIFLIQLNPFKSQHLALVTAVCPKKQEYGSARLAIGLVLTVLPKV